MMNQIRDFLTTGKAISYDKKTLDYSSFETQIKDVKTKASLVVATPDNNKAGKSNPSIIAQSNVQGANNTTPTTPVTDNGMISKMIDTLNNLPAIDLNTI